jgi:hypothetical protein
MKTLLFCLCALTASVAGETHSTDTTFQAAAGAGSSTETAAKPEDTEQWEPVPLKVSPGATFSEAPSDAIVLFDGRNLDEWVMSNDRSPARWRVDKGVLVVDKAFGNIETKRLFKNYQLHLEWRIPPDVTGEGQARGNSGLYPRFNGSQGPRL